MPSRGVKNFINNIYSKVYAFQGYTAPILMNNMLEHPVIKNINNIELYFQSLFDKEFASEIFNINIKNALKVLDAKELKSNPYIKNIFLNKIKKDEVEFSSIDYLRGELIPISEEYFDDEYNILIPIGIFNEYFKASSLKENGNTWMTITPNEFYTMKKPIANSHGKILVFGLGLGYFPYMCSLKKDVSSIDVIENNPVIIELFNNFILPQFEFKEKIKIIEDNAFKYWNNTKKVNSYDYCFVDIWLDRIDGLERFLKFKENDKDLNIEQDFWLQEGFKFTLQQILIYDLFLNVCKGVDFKNMLNYPSPFTEKNKNNDKLRKKAINYLIKNNIKIKTREDINSILKDESIHNLIYKIPLN